MARGFHLCAPQIESDSLLLYSEADFQKHIMMKLSNWLWLGGIFFLFTLIGVILGLGYTEFALVSADRFKIWATVVVAAFVLPGFAALAGFLLMAGISAVGGGLTLAMTIATGQIKNTQIAAFVVIWLGFVLLPLAGDRLWKSLSKPKIVLWLGSASWLGLGLGWLLTRVFKL
jgi:hypothetical protein